MELIQVTNSVSPRLIGLNVKGQSHITIVTVHRHPSIENYDADRTCRMIQRMEEMEDLIFRAINYYKNDNEITKRMKELLKFIEHGDKEETIFVGYFSDDIRDTRIKRIPKSEAIRLGLIDKE